MKTHEFNEIRQLSMSTEQKGREILLINQFRSTMHEDNTTQYIGRKSLKKNKSTNLNSDQQ